MRKMLVGICTLGVAIAVSFQAHAGIVVVDRSPDATGFVSTVNAYSQVYGSQYLAEQFTWNGGMICGGSIYSGSAFGFVGDSVEFVVLPGHAPGAGAGAVPVLQVTTTIDAVDTMGTTIDASMTRKHASIAPTFLAAGNYWFYMAGNAVEIAQGVGNWGDTFIDAGFDGNPDLEAGSFQVGDNFFQLEMVGVPEPSSLSLLGIVGLGLVLSRKRKE